MAPLEKGTRVALLGDETGLGTVDGVFGSRPGDDDPALSGWYWVERDGGAGLTLQAPDDVKALAELEGEDEEMEEVEEVEEIEEDLEGDKEKDEAQNLPPSAAMPAAPQSEIRRFLGSLGLQKHSALLEGAGLKNVKSLSRCDPDDLPTSIPLRCRKKIISSALSYGAGASPDTGAGECDALLVTKGPGEKLGSRFVGTLLKTVHPGTPLDRAGGAAFVGRNLLRVNGKEVNNTEDIIAAAGVAGQGQLMLLFSPVEPNAKRPRPEPTPDDEPAPPPVPSAKERMRPDPPEKVATALALIEEKLKPLGLRQGAVGVGQEQIEAALKAMGGVRQLVVTEGEGLKSWEPPGIIPDELRGLCKLALGGFGLLPVLHVARKTVAQLKRNSTHAGYQGTPGDYVCSIWVASKPMSEDSGLEPNGFELPKGKECPCNRAINNARSVLDLYWAQAKRKRAEEEAAEKLKSANEEAISIDD
eukprot:Hpha_TRINITY_DN9643_c0_g1::TRINITY_DN9643_c0_g1_i1::g.184415::m.184415